MKIKMVAGLILGVVLFLSGCSKDSTAPKVTATFPENGAQNVDPQTTEIWVKFSEPMMDNSWSWSFRDKSKFPETSGNPHYTDDNTKNFLPVQLKPNQEYDIWINTDKFANFKDKAGNSAVPYELKFTTK